MPKKSFNQVPDRDSIDIKIIPEGKSAEQSSHICNEDYFQTYCFEFCSEKNYTVFFEGRLTQNDIHSMLKVVHRHLYKECPEAILSYLEQQRLKYSHFKAEISLSNHKEIMNWTKELLNSSSCDEIDNRISRANNYYAVADHQMQLNEKRCEGCYYAIQKNTNHKNCSYHIIGQTFAYSKYNDTLDGYFAIRTSQNGQQMHNLDVLSGEPVLPVFGCVDMVALLMDIDSLITTEQVIKTALK